MTEFDREPKLGFKMLDLSAPEVAAHLSAQIECHGTVAMDFASQRGRRHLRVRKDGKGYFVSVGSRGHHKQYLGRCKVTYFDGVATLFQYTLSSVDAFEAEQDRRWAESHGLAPLEA